MNNNNDRLLTANELADFLDVPIKTLYAWRHRGEGPIGFRAGRHIRYRWVDVEVWIEDRIRLTETNGRQDHIRSRAHVEDRR
jgi:predicted DNA-binding transcriptional regulator AlpA